MQQEVNRRTTEFYLLYVKDPGKAWHFLTSMGAERQSTRVQMNIDINTLKRHFAMIATNSIKKWNNLNNERFYAKRDCFCCKIYLGKFQLKSFSYDEYIL